MGTKVGEMRETLMEAIESVKAGKMDPSAATAIAKLAGQISLSLQVEANLRSAGLSKRDIGNTPIGDETPAIGS